MFTIFFQLKIFGVTEIYLITAFILNCPPVGLILNIIYYIILHHYISYIIWSNEILYTLHI